MKISEFLNAVSTSRLIDALNACADVFEPFPYIMENDEDNIEDMGARLGTLWVLQGISGGGRFREKDAYVICDCQAHLVYTFTTKEELIEHIGQKNLEDLVDEYRDTRAVAELLEEYGVE